MTSGNLVAAALVAALTVACGGRDDANNTVTDDRDATIGTAGETGAGNIEARDTGDAAPRDVRNFVNDVAAASTAEIELGKLAQEHAANAEVKKFGQMMVTDHTKAANELKQAVQGQVPMPTEMDEKHRELAERLRGLRGAEFDREYMNAMVEGHQDVKGMLEGRADDGNHEAGRLDTHTANDDKLEHAVNQWAAKALPGVEHHLRQAEALRNRLTRNATN